MGITGMISIDSISLPISGRRLISSLMATVCGLKVGTGPLQQFTKT